MKKLRILILLALVFSAPAAAGEGKLSGLVFYDFTYSEDGDPLNSFEYRRAYFTYRQEVSDGITFKFQLDAGRAEGETEGGEAVEVSDWLGMYIKNAKVDWQTAIGTLTFGMQGMNLFPVHEQTWGYRYIEKSPMDVLSYASSADLGIGYANTFGSLHFTALVTNGTGYKNPENDKYKKISTGLTLGERKLSKKDGFNTGAVFTYEPGSGGAFTAVGGIFGGFAKNGVRAGGELDLLKTDGTAGRSEMVIAGYAGYELWKDLDIYGRVDMLDPDTETGGDSEYYTIWGLACSAGRGLAIAPNLRYTFYRDDDLDPVLEYKINFEFKF